MRTVMIRGEGVAAQCCARLLERAGLSVRVEPAERPKLPAIMLGESAQKLLQDVFERDDLFEGLPHIRKRVVAWGSESRARALPHSAVVVSEQDLLCRLQKGSRLPDEPPGPPRGEDAGWTIWGARPLPASSIEHHFGSRMAVATAVKIKASSDRDACWIESLDQGWLFLLPSGDDGGWLLSVGSPVESLLSASRLIADQIEETGAAGGKFPSYPRIAQPLCEPGWLACGTAALGFDPLCGDGTGHATREAILASAVVRAAVGGADVDSLVEHYRTRLMAGFKRHLEVCREFYAGGQGELWWSQELELIERGLTWCAHQLDGVAQSRYRLVGFSLQAIE
jgi:hypothetical protein